LPESSIAFRKIAETANKVSTGITVFFRGSQGTTVPKFRQR
jgi:hypothetical protein